MKLISLKINGFKNLQDFDIDFTKSEGIAVLIGNNGSGKSNVLEAISAIFYGLYYNKIFEFGFKLIYSISNSEIKGEIKIQKEFGENFLRTEYFLGEDFIKKEYKYTNFLKDLLPSNIIALYSGEETRLYENYYFEEYQNYINSIVSGKTNISEEIKMIFINKDFWNIALLVMSASDIDLSNLIGNETIKEIEFIFNEKNLHKFKSNEIVNFCKSIAERGGKLNLEDFKDLGYTHIELYKLLAIGFLPKKESFRLIEDIDITFNNGINSKHLSEGQKKQILIYFVTEVLADKDSIILLDEPDSYVHVGNKEKIKNFLEKFIESYNGEGQVILTTHSPTLMYDFGENHLFYLENGKVSGKEKRKILSEITDGKMSLGEMEVILNSGKKYLLVTEGKTDKKHLELSIEKLGIKDDFDIFPSDGSDKVKQFLIGLPSELLGDKIVIGIFDHDDAGLKAISKNFDKIKDLVYKVKDKDNIYGIVLPCFDENYSKLKTKTIEFMYPADFVKKEGKVEKINLKELNNRLGEDEQLNKTDYEKLEELCYFRFSDNNKNDFVDECDKLDKENFNEFKVLFDLILEIKNK